MAPPHPKQGERMYWKMLVNWAKRSKLSAVTQDYNSTNITTISLMILFHMIDQKNLEAGSPRT